MSWWETPTSAPRSQNSPTETPETTTNAAETVRQLTQEEVQYKIGEYKLVLEQLKQDMETGKTAEELKQTTLKKAKEIRQQIEAWWGTIWVASIATATSEELWKIFEPWDEEHDQQRLWIENYLTATWETNNMEEKALTVAEEFFKTQWVDTTSAAVIADAEVIAQEHGDLFGIAWLVWMEGVWPKVWAYINSFFAWAWSKYNTFLNWIAPDDSTGEAKKPSDKIFNFIKKQVNDIAGRFSLNPLFALSPAAAAAAAAMNVVKDNTENYTTDKYKRMYPKTLTGKAETERDFDTGEIDRSQSAASLAEKAQKHWSIQDAEKINLESWYTWKNNAKNFFSTRTWIAKKAIAASTWSWKHLSPLALIALEAGQSDYGSSADTGGECNNGFRVPNTSEDAWEWAHYISKWQDDANVNLISFPSPEWWYMWFSKNNAIFGEIKSDDTWMQQLSKIWKHLGNDKIVEILEKINEHKLRKEFWVEKYVYDETNKWFKIEANDPVDPNASPDGTPTTPAWTEDDQQNWWTGTQSTDATQWTAWSDAQYPAPEPVTTPSTDTSWTWNWEPVAQV